MVVPWLSGAIDDMDRADAALDEPAREETAVGERCCAVFCANGRRLGANVEGVGRFGLHAEGGFHRLNAAFQKLVFADSPFVFAVQSLDEIELLTLGRQG